MKFRPTPALKLVRRLARSIEENGFRNALVRSCGHLTRSLKNRGLRATFQRAVVKPPDIAATAAAELPHPFDVQHGTDTGGYLTSADMDSVSLSSLYTTSYYGVAPSALIRAITAFDIDFSRFTFVDIGCGKGRALMVAASFPFPRLEGIELSADLSAIAEANMRLKPEWASRIHIANEDATKYQYPKTPLLLFMFNPFLRPILRRVLKHLEAQLQSAPRETYLLYERNPRYTDVLSSFPFLREVSETTYPLSEEDSAVDRWNITQEKFTVYASTIK